jgi:DNA-binding transcriptional LysR family regulator
MGVQLFERTSRRVELTPAGAIFLAESRKVLDAVDTAVARAQRTGRPHRLVLATRAGIGRGLLADLMRAYRRQPGSADVEVVFTRDQAAALRDGTADVALMCGRGDITGFGVAGLLEERSVALIAPEHPLATRPFVTLTELTAQPAFHQLCPEDSLDQILDRVSLGELIVVAGESIRTGESVVSVPVLDVPTTQLVLAWAEGTTLPARTALVRTARNLLQPVAGLGGSAVDRQLDAGDIAAVG